MALRDSPRGKFLACTAYPSCRTGLAVDQEGRPVMPADTGVRCVRCGKPMLVKRGPRGPFLGCSGYPGCQGTHPDSRGA